MKKLFPPAVVIAAITLASCTKQEIITDPTPIQFDLFVGKPAGVQTKGVETKGYVLDPTTLKTEHGYFYVHAFMTGKEEWKNHNRLSEATAGNFLDNQEITWNDPNWEYLPLAYWPANEGKVSFFAVTSWLDGINVPAGTNGALSFPYTVMDAVSYQQDLLVAIPVYNQYKTAGQPAGKVKFTFQHVLSKIDFKARLETNYTAADVVVKVTGLSLVVKASTVLVKGTYTLPTDPAGTSSGAWTLSTGNDYYDYMSTHTEYLYPPYKQPGDQTPSPVVELSHEEAKSIIADDYYLMLLPQDIPANTFKLELSYTIETTDLADTEKEHTRTTVYPATEIFLPENDLTLLQGRQYTFLLKFNLETVSVSAELQEGWIAGGGEEKEI